MYVEINLTQEIKKEPISKLMDFHWRNDILGVLKASLSFIIPTIHIDQGVIGSGNLRKLHPVFGRSVLPLEGSWAEF